MYVALLLIVSDFFFPEGDNYTVVYLQEVPLHGMYMFKGEGVHTNPIVPRSHPSRRKPMWRACPTTLYSLSFVHTAIHHVRFCMHQSKRLVL